MKALQTTMCTRVAGGVTAFMLPILGNLGCATAPPMQMQAHRYRTEVQLDPTTHTLIGRTVLDLARSDDEVLPPGEPVTVELLLHPDLSITQVRASGASARYRGPRTHKAPKQKGEAEQEFTPTTHVVVLDRPVEALSLFVEYQGELFQDVSAGEKPGEIHNFEMRAHIGNEGIYLADGCWYPQPAIAKGTPRALADHILLADPVPGLELVAGGDPAPQLGEPTGRLAWRSPYPIEEMVLVGGPHEIHETTHNDVTITVHLKPEQAQHAEGLMNAARRYLDRYEPLVGPYPAKQFSIVDNFFSSGFAFPTFTLLSSAVINMGPRSQTMHGFIDHEMLHCWWGNGIHVDPSDGNWCEALASYGANYYGYVLDGNEEDARRKRRNYSHFLSRMDPEEDKPLGTFDLDDGCGRNIAYSKGAMVIHMLARRMGQENFWTAMRRLTAEYTGRYASWEDIRQVCEEVGGMPLETFFTQWVRRSGAPSLSLEGAKYNSAEQTLTIKLSQGEPVFELDVPIRILHADGTLDIDVPLRLATEEVSVPVGVVPLSVELDPDYHLFRKVPASEIVPTTAATRHGSSLATVLPAGDVPEKYQTLRGIFESSFEKDGETVAYTVGEIEEGALAERCVLILGEAVRDPYVSAFLSAIEFPVRFGDEGFELHNVTYAEPGYALLCTVRHPDVPGGGVTVIYANDDEAIPRPWNIPMYDRSLVIFKDHRPILRHDFERRTSVRVEQ